MCSQFNAERKYTGTTRAILGGPPNPTTWDTGSQNTLVIGRPSSAVKENFSENLPTHSKFDSNGPTSNFPEYDGQASIVISYRRQPTPTSHRPHPAPQPVVHVHPENPPPQQMNFHQRGDSEVTIVEQRTRGHPSRNYSDSSNRSGSVAAPVPPPQTLVPERVTTPELLQRPTTPSSVLAMKVENPQSTSPIHHRRNISRIANDGALSTGSFASHSPSTSIGSQSERGIKGTGGEQTIEVQQPSSWTGPRHDAALSAVMGSQDALIASPIPTQLSQRSPYSPKRPFVPGHHRNRSRPGFL